jgi:histidyl-tRNA synthetase
MPFGHRSLKAQLKAANTSRARVAVIIGEDELAQGSVAIRDLQDHQQRTVPAIELPHHLRAVDEA